MIGTQARLFSKLIKPEESGINKNEESTAPTKIYRAKKNKKIQDNIHITLGMNKIAQQACGGLLMLASVQLKTGSSHSQ